MNYFAGLFLLSKLKHSKTHEMRNIASIIILLLLTFSAAQSQSLHNGQECFKRVINLVRENRISELASILSYPLTRPNPLPNIQSKDEFIKYYPVLFDSAFKAKLVHSDSSDIWVRSGDFTIFHGDIWLNPECEIITINYTSARERNVLDSLTEFTKRIIHPSVAQWQENILILDARKFIIRLDWTDNGLRYASWNTGHTISDKPDLILYKGVSEAQGSQGGMTYTFTKGQWKYVLDEVDMCSTPEECGVFLEILHRGREVNRIKCKLVK